MEYAFRSGREEAGLVDMGAGDSEKPLPRPKSGRFAKVPPRDCCGAANPKLGAVRGGSPGLFMLTCLGLEKFSRGGAISCLYSGDSGLAGLC